jgi:hypothetical protein
MLGRSGPKTAPKFDPKEVLKRTQKPTPNFMKKKHNFRTLKWTPKIVKSGRTDGYFQIQSWGPHQRRHFGFSLAPSGPILAYLGAFLAPSWPLLSPSWRILVFSWRHFGSFQTQFGISTVQRRRNVMPSCQKGAVGPFRIMNTLGMGSPRILRATHHLPQPAPGQRWPGDQPWNVPWFLSFGVNNSITRSG